MTIFSLSYKHRTPDDDATTINSVMKAWEGLQVAEDVWILKRNDGCTCRDIISDLQEHISADNDITVVELKEENNKLMRAFNIIPAH